LRTTIRVASAGGTLDTLGAESDVTSPPLARNVPELGGPWAALGTALLAVLATAVVLRATPAAAYRPFVSTDAAVAETREVEVELGYFTVDRTDGSTVYTVPEVVLNYGLVEDVEVVGEFGLAEQAGEELQVADPEISLKTVLKDGVLQDKPGVSVAVETGLVLPSTVEGERRFGFEVVGIVSEQLSPVMFHLNVGGGIDRAESNPLVIWGLIAEIPAHPRLRLVSEVNGESTEGEAAQDSGLLGFIWQPLGPEFFWDLGVRKGFSHAVSDWGVTTGLTFSWSPFASAR
jgi:hypothetical protein